MDIAKTGPAKYDLRAEHSKAFFMMLQPTPP